MDDIELHRCDRCPARAQARITLIPTMGVLHACGHHARAWADEIQGEYEIAYAMETVGA